MNKIKPSEVGWYLLARIVWWWLDGPSVVSIALTFVATLFACGTLIALGKLLLRVP